MALGFDSTVHFEWMRARALSLSGHKVTCNKCHNETSVDMLICKSCRKHYGLERPIAQRSGGALQAIFSILMIIFPIILLYITPKEDVRDFLSNIPVINPENRMILVVIYLIILACTRYLFIGLTSEAFGGISTASGRMSRKERLLRWADGIISDEIPDGKRSDALLLYAISMTIIPQEHEIDLLDHEKLSSTIKNSSDVDSALMDTINEIFFAELIQRRCLDENYDFDEKNNMLETEISLFSKYTDNTIEYISNVIIIFDEYDKKFSLENSLIGALSGHAPKCASIIQRGIENPVAR